MRAASARVDGAFERPPHGEVGRQRAQLQRLGRQVAVRGERLGARCGGGVGDAPWPPVSMARRTPARCRRSRGCSPRIGQMEQRRRARRPSPSRRPENPAPEVTITSLPAFSVMATVTGVVRSFQPLGKAPTVVVAPGAECAVVRGQDLLVGQALQRIAERAPLAHAAPRAEAVAGQVDGGVRVGGRRRGRDHGEHAREPRHDDGGRNDANQGAALSEGGEADTDDGSDQGTTVAGPWSSASDEPASLSAIRLDGTGAAGCSRRPAASPGSLPRCSSAWSTRPCSAASPTRRARRRTSPDCRTGRCHRRSSPNGSTRRVSGGRSHRSPSSPPRCISAGASSSAPCPRPGASSTSAARRWDPTRGPWSSWATPTPSTSSWWSTSPPTTATTCTRRPSPAA